MGLFFFYFGCFMCNTSNWFLDWLAWDGYIEFLSSPFIYSNFLKSNINPLQHIIDNDIDKF